MKKHIILLVFLMAMLGIDATAQGPLFRLFANQTDYYTASTLGGSNLFQRTNLISATRFLTTGTGKLLGRGTAGTGGIEEITLGTGLSFSGTTLNGVAGTVTSVAATVPSILTISGTPVTTAGTLAFALQTQNANLVFAGPTSGGAATPTFRSLVAADISSLNLDNWTASGTTNSLLAGIERVWGQVITNVGATKLMGTDANGATTNVILSGLTYVGNTLTASGGSVSMDLVTALAASRAVQNGAFTNLDMFTDPGAGKASYTIKGTNSTASTTFDIRGQMTSATASFLNLTETTASTGGSGAQYLANFATIASSTATPFRVAVRGNELIRASETGLQFLATDGSTTIPVYGFTSRSTSGLLYNSGPQIQYNSTIYVKATASAVTLLNSAQLDASTSGINLYSGANSALVANTGDSTHAGLGHLRRVLTTSSGTVTLTTGVDATTSVGSGTIHNVTGTVTVAFPATPTIGDNYTVIVNTGNTVTLDPAGASQVLRIGAAITTANTGTATSSTQGSTIVFVYASANLWIAVEYTGTWGTT